MSNQIHKELNELYAELKRVYLNVYLEKLRKEVHNTLRVHNGRLTELQIKKLVYYRQELDATTHVA